MALALMEDLMIGAASGASKIMLGMPLLTWKFKMQAGESLPTNLSDWYRGAVIQACAIAPIAAMQMLVNGVLCKVISGASPFSEKLNRELTYTERMVAAVFAGIVPALIYTPVDLITLQQQQLGVGTWEAAGYIVEHRGPLGLMHGAVAMSMREGVYTLGMLGLTPIISEWLLQQDTFFKGNKMLANLTGSMTSGITAALMTHPMDTIKTRIQVDLFSKKYTNVFSTAWMVVRHEGVSSLFSGLVPRTLMVCIAFFVAVTLRQLYTSMKAALAMRYTGPALESSEKSSKISSSTAAAVKEKQF